MPKIPDLYSGHKVIWPLYFVFKKEMWKNEKNWFKIVDI